MENQIKQYTDSHAELYDLVLQKAVKELGLPVKKRKRYVGFGNICGFYMFWIGIGQDCALFTSRTTFSRTSNDNKIEIVFEEANKETILEAIDRIYADYLHVKESGELTEMLSTYKHRASRREPASDPDNQTIKLWNELIHQVNDTLAEGKGISAIPSPEAIAEAERLCRNADRLFDILLDSLQNMCQNDSLFIKSFNIYRKYISSDTVSLSSLGAEIGYTREWVRQRVTKVNKCIQRKIRNLISSSPSELQQCVMELYEIFQSIDFDAVSLYAFGLPNVSNRKKSALLTALFGQTACQKILKVGQPLRDGLEVLAREAETAQRLAEEWEEKYQRRICFPSAVITRVPILTEERNYDFEYEYKRAFYTRLKKYHPIVDVIPSPDIIYYRSNIADHRPDLLLRLPDGSAVLVLVAPTLNLAISYNLTRFNNLHLFCKQNGYGYLIVSDRGVSVFDIKSMDIDHSLAEALNDVLDRNGIIFWKDIVEIKKSRSVTNEEIAAFVLKNKLDFKLRPFTIKLKNNTV